MGATAEASGAHLAILRCCGGAAGILEESFTAWRVPPAGSRGRTGGDQSMSSTLFGLMRR